MGGLLSSRKVLAGPFSSRILTYAALSMGWQPVPGWFEPQSPNVFWPAERSWIVASDIDFDSTLVGGSQELIASILEALPLDAWRVDPQDQLASDGDLINPAP